jgi:hypothetical protein
MTIAEYATKELTDADLRKILINISLINDSSLRLEMILSLIVIKLSKIETTIKQMK